MKFALITADKSHQVKIRMNGESDDVTSFLQWVTIFDGVLLSYDSLRGEDKSYLKDFDVVMMSGHLNYIQDIIDIARFLKDSQTISMFYPEGSTQLYDNSISGYHREYYEAWRACDVISMAEEDKQSYYEAFVTNETVVRFIHVPITMEMASSILFQPRCDKRMETLVYGDNNPNHPLIALACANKLGIPVLGIDIRKNHFESIFPDLDIAETTKLGAYPFMRLLGRGIVHFYPTEWIGTARQQISCACVGTPCIGNKDSHTQQRLWPRLASGIYDVNHMTGLASELINSTAFYDEVVSYALDNLRFYDLGNTISRFMGAVDEARNRFKKVKVAV